LAETAWHLRRKVNINEADKDNAQPSEYLLQATIGFSVDGGRKKEEKGTPARQLCLEHERIHAYQYRAQLIQLSDSSLTLAFLKIAFFVLYYEFVVAGITFSPT